MSTGFYLEDFKITNRKKIIFDVKFFKDVQQSNEQPFSSVIIGANGSGKSYLLTLITEVFRAIENKQKFKDYSLRYDYYLIKYLLDDVTYLVEIYKKKFKITRNQSIINIGDVKLPNKVLAVSFMVNDKFVFKGDDKTSDDVYEYLGVRRTSNATWTNSVVRKVSEAIIENGSKEGFNLKVKNILEFLNYESKITLIFEPKRKTLFKRSVPTSLINSRINRIKKSEEYRSFSINKIKDVDINGLIEFINETTLARPKIKIDNSNCLKYVIDLSSNENYLVQEDYKYLQMLMDLDWLKPPTLLLFKDEEFEFEHASSGEKQFLFTMINIASKLEENSLILIDEPELSFHPNWQMNYINYLKIIFEDFSNCHFILATHSHYIVSDLRQETSSLIKLSTTRNSETVRQAELIEYSTYAWSAENILYNIFEVRTTRNYYFDMDLRKIVSLIKDKTTDLDALEVLITKLKKFIFDDLDPINLIISDAERFLENAKSNSR